MMCASWCANKQRTKIIILICPIVIVSHSVISGFRFLEMPPKTEDKCEKCTPYTYREKHYLQYRQLYFHEAALHKKKNSNT